MIHSNQPRRDSVSVIRLAAQLGASVPVGVSGLVLALLVVVPSMAWGQTSNSSKRPASSMVYEGFTEPNHDIMVAATEIGRLESVTVDVGDVVRAGIAGLVGAYCRAASRNEG